MSEGGLDLTDDSGIRVVGVVTEKNATGKTDRAITETAAQKRWRWGPRPSNGAGAQITEITHRQLGLKIFKLVAALTVLMVIVVVLFGAFTYPRPTEVADLTSGLAGDTRLATYREIHSDWVQQMTTLGQLFLFGSLVPLLGTIAGYVLGQRSAVGNAADD